jgi:hypothetical protein
VVLGYHNPWLYQNEPFDDEDLGDYIGFVYLITNLQSGKQYIGKKLLHSSRVKKIPGKKRRARVKSASNWKDYYGSNKELIADMERLGSERFKREILHLCRSRGEVN